MDSQINPIGVFISSFGVAAFAGLAALLRTGTKLSVVTVLSQLLNSGLLGLGISLLWYTKFQDNIYFLVGVCLLAGLGGMTTVEFVLQAIRKGGFSINLGGKDSQANFTVSDDPKKQSGE
jgi:hypothetical protein